ncbi:MAG: hypothetical protein QW453_06945 [Thermoprotei archaeon]
MFTLGFQAVRKGYYDDGIIVYSLQRLKAAWNTNPLAFFTLMYG